MFKCDILGEQKHTTYLQGKLCMESAHNTTYTISNRLWKEEYKGIK